MADGRQREAWNHTAAWMALAYNLKKGKRGAAKQLADYHLFNLAEQQQAAEEEEQVADFSILKTVFVDRKLPT